MDTKYLKKVAVYIITAAASLLFIAYIIYHLWSEYNTEVTSVPAEYVTMEQSITVDAYILRDETVLYADTEGTVDYAFDDGDKVSAGDHVATVYADGDIGKKLIDIDSRISVLERSRVDSSVVSDTATIDSKIDSVYYRMLGKIGSGDLDSAMSLTSDIVVLLNKRALITKSVDGYDDAIAELRSERDTLSAASEAIEDIVTDKAGYFYSQTDGYEGVFSSRNIDQMQLASYDMLASAMPSASTYEGGKHTVGKIVTDYRWYVVCAVSTAEYRNLSLERSSYYAVFPASDDRRVEMKLYKVVNPADDDRTLLIFYSAEMPDGFDYSHNQTVEIITAEYSGYKVPASAVTIQDGKKGVFVLDSSVVGFKEIVPLFERDGWIVCEERDVSDESQTGRLSLYDFVITGGKDLYDGKKLQ